ncbi:ribosome small subunit-dependent GTPase A [Chondrinema litorale]|uniref:ribosome small subunit-dependent GTPase A n=1 Tax=Chondrinema litorale TaxID=2994555 RepID=UPI002544B75A|nr:ribosome small subunit-dependent GTPase A [Chondrinema litorale]UZR95582.1 ribosome small subunit-dependent GTPase A [Chondrinema litorale]
MAGKNKNPKNVAYQQGTIIRSTGSWYEILAEDDKIYKGRLRGKFKIKGIKATNPIAVGDNVSFFSEDTEESTVVINSIEDRDNYIIRQSTHKKGHIHIIASNLDQAVLIATISMPRTSLGFIDRFLVSCESFHVPACIIFNKADLLSEEEENYLAYLTNLYSNLDYKVLSASALYDDTLSDITAYLKGKTSLIAGHSGVGKSTLINRLVPNALQRTAEVSNFAKKGVHTTTYAEMFKMDEASYLIDTPGIKEFGILGLEEYEVSYFFPEIREESENCKYYNCTHTHEPGCAVVDAVNEEKIEVSRYRSYLSILENEDNRR